MEDPKIKELRDEIAKNIIREFFFQIDEVLSMCDSAIERIMLLHLFKYFQKIKLKEEYCKKYHSIEFIEEEIILCPIDHSDAEIKKLTERVKKYHFRYVPPLYLKNVGFRVSDSFSESITTNQSEPKNSAPLDLAFREYEVRPQYPVNIDGKDYRIDIAVFLHRKSFFDNKIIETRKLALECDGYDFHSSPTQKRDDDIRIRKLKKSGWKEVLRYSGKEIHSLKSLNEIHDLFEEIVEILYA